jgi:DNA replication and repair protein RecF
MQVERIELIGFRNYGNLDIRVYPGVNVFYGDNAQGKTNILESVYMCACARSHRTSRDTDIIRHEDDFYSIKLAFTNRVQQEEIVVSFQEADPGNPERARALRTVLHNGMRLPRVADMMGIFHAVIFAPEDLMLVKEGPATRRRYLDLLLSQIRPTYFSDLQAYTRALSQRNALLKRLRIARTDAGEDSELEVWEDAMAESGSRLILARQQVSGRIMEIAAREHSRISSDTETLVARYRTVSTVKEGDSQREIAEKYRTRLRQSVREDAEKGMTSQGPHRDDLELGLDGEGLRPFASQGQQRSAVLALKLAELQVLQEETGEPPVLLLDDVMSELDARRRNALIEGMGAAQVFVTCTDAAHVGGDMKELAAQGKGMHYFHVERGQVAESPDLLL